ncbi:MAG TPA: alternative ribosome rescue aminoacyl-tRNA hydrolase ArfB [Saprospiraceae bacterium]|nr:alternative ribosome rescue aminoacyl-tRNA hydrolase ArfB [Saprospiraceae bacterium]
MDWNTILTEVAFRTSRSSGAGGQHVNKTETKVEVLFDVQSSAGLTDAEKELVYQKLGARINDEGILGLTSQKERSQLANKAHALERLQELLGRAIIPKMKRIKTRPTKQSVEERLQEKKAQSDKKAMRKKPGIK